MENLRCDLFLRKPLPDPDLSRFHVNELDRFRRQMREKDLGEMIFKLEQLKTSAKYSEEIIHTLTNIRDRLDFLQSEVKIKRKIFFSSRKKVFVNVFCFMFSLRTAFPM